MNGSPNTAAALRERLDGVASFPPGGHEYVAATSPENLSVTQKPDLVIRPSSARDLATAVAVARRSSATLSVQATGHGAASTLGPDTILIDTGSLAGIRIDPLAQVAYVGAGARWGAVQSAAAQHGLLGLAGTSPGVGVSGYTFGGGVGWFARAHGLASGKLRAVRYVDGRGRLRRAADDAVERSDRDAIWAFRGGAPVGIASELEFELIRPGELWAGHLLWPADSAERVIAAWAATLADLPETITSTMALLHLPPVGPFPDDLLGTPVVHLSYAAADDPGALSALQKTMRAVARPVVDSTGPSTVDRLAGIHLDPPGRIAAAGGGRWLTAEAAGHAAELLLAARVGASDGLAMAELRHVASHAPALPGAVTAAPGPFVFHVVGNGDEAHRAATRSAIQGALATAAGVSVDTDAVSFREGDPTVAESSTETATRLRAIGHALDPDGVFRFERVAR